MLGLDTNAGLLVAGAPFTHLSRNQMSARDEPHHRRRSSDSPYRFHRNWHVARATYVRRVLAESSRVCFLLHFLHRAHNASWSLMHSALYSTMPAAELFFRLTGLPEDIMEMPLGHAIFLVFSSPSGISVVCRVTVSVLRGA
ncbi:hypothetical protein L227DRAFT_600812 [Lentinus tigrinus ALCF2SS1-6]|uniref:Uncharacterized protein n=1 Tax=Lentinus tigrinus ALCF2SS1-6 TaxID=1328759 RepID=A0A5C2SA50_9APHY|nr:hypothetical protein L227DRAFT_600812 [Lentinus tigrinus ALCF2SS1-6]